MTRVEVFGFKLKLRRYAWEVGELQKALSDAHAYLFEERDRVLAMQAGAYTRPRFSST
jgi:coiled-coil domain-containing protein 77